MNITELINQHFNVEQIDVPNYLKLCFLLKDKFEISDIYIEDILNKIKTDNPTADTIRKYIYEKIKFNVNTCKNCSLYLSESCTQKVMGDGTLKSPLMLIGEGPGFEEDKKGKPFVGRAGQLLTVILTKLGINRNKIYITNVIKCRPKNNRTPKRNEIQACSQNLELELKFVAPKVILTLGAVPLDYFSPGSRIMRSRGKWIYSDGYWIMPTYHPAFILRQRGKSLYRVKWQVWEDFNKALAKVKELSPDYEFK